MHLVTYTTDAFEVSLYLLVPIMRTIRLYTAIVCILSVLSNRGWCLLNHDLLQRLEEAYEKAVGIINELNKSVSVLETDIKFSEKFHDGFAELLEEQFHDGKDTISSTTRTVLQITSSRLDFSSGTKDVMMDYTSSDEPTVYLTQYLLNSLGEKNFTNEYSGGWGKFRSKSNNNTWYLQIVDDNSVCSIMFTEVLANEANKPYHAPKMYIETNTNEVHYGPGEFAELKVRISKNSLYTEVNMFVRNEDKMVEYSYKFPNATEVINMTSRTEFDDYYEDVFVINAGKQKYNGVVYVSIAPKVKDEFVTYTLRKVVPVMQKNQTEAFPKGFFEFLNFNDEVFCKLGEKCELNFCIIGSNPSALTIWKLLANGSRRQLSAIQYKYRYMVWTMLSITNVQPVDAGIYCLKGTDKHGQLKNVYFQLYVGLIESL